ncbi:hypothetical protein TNCV_4724371 [Trichonephila clavipes]|uniref:Uncharacterized protein n=1 Tax=Trichonephila clavipes TaxID=2585209 RepID=A0A8X6W7F8_TRICX|nr:hypothetical protein TNCV_4724371 [Trichonephila clavipes]
MAPRLRRAKGADHITARVTNEGRFVLSTFRSERTNEASTLTITPKRSSSRDVGSLNGSIQHCRYRAYRLPCSQNLFLRNNSHSLYIYLVQKIIQKSSGVEIVSPRFIQHFERLIRGCRGRNTEFDVAPCSKDDIAKPDE